MGKGRELRAEGIFIVVSLFSIPHVRFSWYPACRTVCYSLRVQRYLLLLVQKGIAKNLHAQGVVFRRQAVVVIILCATAQVVPFSALSRQHIPQRDRRCKQKKTPNRENRGFKAHTHSLLVLQELQISRLNKNFQYGMLGRNKRFYGRSNGKRKSRVF